MTSWSAGQYQAVAQRIAPIADEIVVAAAPGPGNVVVDLACGTGNAALAAASAGATVTGVDLTPELLAIAAAEPGGSDVTWLTADAAATGLPDAIFDTAVSNMGIIFVEPVSMVTELARLLKSHGVLAFSTWVRSGDNPFHTPMVDVLGAPAALPYSPDQWGDPHVARTRLSPDFTDISIKNGFLTWQFGSLDTAVRFVTRESPMHVSTLAAVDDATRARLVEAFTTALSAHQRMDGVVAFDAPYSVITARRR